MASLLPSPRFVAAVAELVRLMKAFIYTAKFWKACALCLSLALVFGTSGCQTCEPFSVTEEREMQKFGFMKKPEEKEPHLDLFQILADLLPAVIH